MRCEHRLHLVVLVRRGIGTGLRRLVGLEFDVLPRLVSLYCGKSRTCL